MSDKYSIPEEWDSRIQFHDDGKKIELLPDMHHEILLSVSYQRIEIDKLIGPTAFAGLRIQADAKTCEWIIERQNISTSEWSEFCRIPGQTDADYPDEK